MNLCLRHLILSVVVAVSGAASAQAQVSANGFRARVQVDVRATPAQVFAALVQVGEWWSPDHTFTGDAKNLSIDARAGGCFCERLANGGGVEHMRVVYVSPGEMLRMSGALGPLQALGVAGSLTMELKPTFGGTAVEVFYSVGGFSETGFTQLAPAVQSVLSEQMNRLKSYIENGRPAR